jgi:hypothetical protein
MRLTLRIALLAALATLALATAGLALAGGGSGKWGKVASAKHGTSQAQGTAGPAAAGGGQGGAVTNHGGCEIPGLPGTVTGNGNIVVNNGGTNFTCHGELPAGTPAPDHPEKVDLGDCQTMVTPSGKAKTTCHSKNP